MNVTEQTITIINSEGASVGTANLSPQVFNIEPNRQVMHEAVRSYLANQRQGTASTMNCPSVVTCPGWTPR